MATTRRERPLRPGPATADEAVAAIEVVGSERRAAGRLAIGVTGTDDTPSLRAVITGSGAGWYPMVALGLLVVVDEFQSNAITVLGPEITAALGFPRAALAAVILLKTLVLTLAVLPIAALVQRHPRRASVSIVTAFAWSALTAATGFVVSIWGLLALLAANGASGASVRAVHEPLLLDTYPPEARVRALSFYRGADSVGRVVGPLLIGACTVFLDLTWRGVFVALGVVCVLAAIGAVRLRDPGFGRWDTERVRALVRTDDAAPDELSDDDVALGFFEITRRVLLIPTVRMVLLANAVVGMLLVPFVTYLSFFLQEDWGMGPGGRSLFTAAMSLFGVVALSLFGRRGETMFRQDPARLLRLAGTLMAVGITTIALAIFSPLFVVMVVLFGTAFAMVSLMAPAMSMAMFSIVPAHMRPHLAGLSGIATAGVGGTAGLLLLSGIDRRFGTAGAILSLALPGTVAGLILRRAARTVNADMDRMIGEILEEEEIRTIKRTGVRLPMLACRHVAFSYGSVQVLFDVNFTVDDGEMVALLGTNGAGKSTLLNVVSGIGLPDQGSVRFRGADITYLETTRRVGLGIRQVPGGRGVFGTMTVLENLRVLGHVNGRDRGAVNRGIEASFEAFPRLAERRDQRASTLSGGEQQMLTLASAYLCKPRLLLIDELSLGLAPKIVAELLEMVRRINATGTAVVLVEQSVTTALSLVEHAYFMEKGEIRFDGEASALLARPDLLRSVFLQGVGNAAL